MTTLDELERSVERLNRAVERLSSGMGKYGFANVYNDDIQLLLSKRAELLDTVGRLRLELVTAGMHIEISPGPCEDRAKRIVQNIRAALTTGEAGSPIGQNDQPDLA